jgi:hypothetical protein
MYVRALQKRQENENHENCNLQEAGMKLAPSFSVFPFHILHDSGYAMKPTIIYDKSTSGNSTLLFEIVPS